MVKAKATEVLNQLTEADFRHCFQQLKSPLSATSRTVNLKKLGLVLVILAKECDTREREQFELINKDEIIQNISPAPDTERDIIQTPPVKSKYTPKCTHSEERLRLLKQIAGMRTDSDTTSRYRSLRKEDENDLFFASMAQIVKKLPKASQARLRMNIANLVGNAEIEHLSMTPPEYRPSSAANSST
ncbi:hypothetical protein NQ318_021104 [Aromia moschata]|uniref:BESS domain-containing protein n=1 Tax=Aromia moschata TaxID=1265417 RepID=A0AAV8XFW2_9CUCU|nr:hypothetical protein NQ318_021104 [Aromia moschata]